MARPLQAVFFDIDDTLFSTTVFADKARRAAVDAMIQAGLRASREACLKELNEVIAEFTSNHEYHFDKVIRRLPSVASEGLNPAVVVAAGVVAYHETKWRELKVYDDVYEVLRWLATHEQIVRGVISAGWAIKQAEKLIRLEIYEFLTPHAIYFTDQIGISKPNPKLYRRVVSDLKLDPSQVVYVGDNPTHDTDPAKAEGLIAIRSRRAGRYAAMTGALEPDFEVGNFYELKTILTDEFGL
ncbi:MAG: HAD-IA family hydrolase [Planctomycetota bacterium]